jgi:hypothetical protein
MIGEWAGDYDAATVDSLPIKYTLGRIANHRNDGYLVGYLSSKVATSASTACVRSIRLSCARPRSMDLQKSVAG